MKEKGKLTAKGAKGAKEFKINLNTFRLQELMDFVRNYQCYQFNQRHLSRLAVGQRQGFALNSAMLPHGLSAECLLLTAFFTRSLSWRPDRPRRLSASRRIGREPLF